MTQPQIAVGTAQSRVDGRLKVTGAATYAADHAVDGVAYAVMVDSTVGRGRITAIDTGDALAHPGVLQVINHTNAPRLAYRDNEGSNNPPGARLKVFQDDRVLFFGQPVAVVVADSLEAAQHGARLVAVSYESRSPSTDLVRAKADSPTLYTRGDAESALSTAPVRLDMTYRTARNHHNPMEPHATIARWDGDELTLWDKTQWVVGGTQQELASVFGINQEAIHVISPFVGGAFGSGLRAWPHVTVAALAARQVGRPVKVVLSRRQLYFGTGYRPAYTYQVALASTRDGRLTAMKHDIRGETSSYETFTEEVLAPGQMLYSVPHVAQSYSTAPLDVNTPIWMRGPGMATAVMVVESAMDELACELGLDPIELRLRNEPDGDQSSGLPFSTSVLSR
ncbi:molybdopterin cofactor-binding domain-containing protein [Mycobacterium sp. NPDC006124]|uniref:xanthine dehydrogenase family protein molybdopterin-binding subunit n=1 Tax=Mycobacterium sp. NPDC006124 TaxID=3156729 RepID=UPI00339E99A0